MDGGYAQLNLVCAVPGLATKLGAIMDLLTSGRDMGANLAVQAGDALRLTYW
jgi:hypothetical protein